MLSPDRATRTASPLATVWQRCRDWITGNAGSDLKCCGEEEVARIAQDLRISAGELRSLVARGPEAAELLMHRMAALDLDPEEVSRVQGPTFQDLQRVCTMCESRRRCARDLAHDAAGPQWKDYCPNAGTLLALDAMPWAKRREW